MKGYKAFGKGMICAPDKQHVKQYAENTVYEEDSAEVCKKGMHFCKDPLAVLDYYPLVDANGEMSEFAKVEALDECTTDDGQKYCTKKLKVGAKLSFPALVQASVNFEFEKSTNGEKNEKISSKSNSARIGSSGNWARIGSSGNSARIGSSGNSAQIASSGKHSVICCAGNNSIVKAKTGSWITLSEWKFSDKENAYIPICVKTEYVDGEKIKADVFYKLVNGKFEEVTV
jgi:hypothetical protein